MKQYDNPIGYYVRQALQQMGDGSYADELAVRKIYDRLVGRTIVQLTSSFSLKRGTLVIRVMIPSLRYELLMRRGGLRQAINAELRREAVKKIVVL